MRIPKELWRALDTATMLSVPQAAPLLNCDERTIRAACAAGDIPATRVGAKWLIPTWWLKKQVKPPSEAAMVPISQAARLLGCSRRTILKGIAAESIPATKVGEQWRISAEWLRRQVKPSEAA